MNPFKLLYWNQIAPRTLTYGHFQLRALQWYSSDFEGPFAQQVFETESTSIRLNLLYSHVWLWKHHLVNNNTLTEASEVDSPVFSSDYPLINSSLGALNYSAEISRLLQIKIKHEHVYVYSNTFDTLILDELKRKNRVINHLLRGQLDKSQHWMEDFVYSYIFEESEEATESNVQKVAKYFTDSLEQDDFATLAARVEGAYFDHLKRIEQEEQQKETESSA